MNKNVVEIYILLDMQNSCLHRIFDSLHREYPCLSGNGLRAAVAGFFGCDVDIQIGPDMIEYYLNTLSEEIRIKMITMTLRPRPGQRGVYDISEITHLGGNPFTPVLPEYLVLVNTRESAGYGAGHYYLMNRIAHMFNYAELIGELNECGSLDRLALH